MTQEHSERSEEEKRLDHLVIEATSDYSLAPDREEKGYDVAASDQQARQQWRRKRLAVIISAIAIGVGIISYSVYGYWHGVSTQRRQAAAEKAEQTRLSAVQEKTEAEVKRLVAENRFSDALDVLGLAADEGLPDEVLGALDTRIGNAAISFKTAEVRRLIVEHEFDKASRTLKAAGPKGLPEQQRIDLEEAIGQAALDYRTALLNKAEEAINSRSPQVSQGFLDRAKALTKWEVDARRTGKLVAALSRLRDEMEMEATRQLLTRSRRAAEKKNWDQAISLLEEARRGAHEDEEVEDCAGALIERVAGRLVVLGAPEGATVRLLGRDPWPARQVVAGIRPGPVEVLVEAEGHVPEIVQAEAPSFPDTVEVTVELRSEAPGPLWTVYALAGHCAQETAAIYYRRTHAEAPWIGELGQLLEPCLPESSKMDKAKISKKALAALVRAATAAFMADGGDTQQGLEQLGELIAKHPKSGRSILKRCGSGIGRSLERIERGCATCLGGGAEPCFDCDGDTQREELRACESCQGRRGKPHKTCKGTGLVKCKKCKGSGQIVQTTKVPRGDRRITESTRIPCPRCEGEKTTACRCKDGKIDCKACKGAGSRVMMGPCTSCDGRGSTPCEICDSTGRRHRMEPLERRAIERALNPGFDSEP